MDFGSYKALVAHLCCKNRLI